MRVVKLPHREAEVQLQNLRTFNKRYVDRYRIVTDNPSDGADTILSALPAFGSFWPGGGFPIAILTDKRPRQDPRALTVWEADVVYSTVNVDPSRQDENPLNRPPDVSYDYIERTRTVDKDVNGKLLCYSSGEVIQSGLEDDELTPILTVEVNLPSFDASVSRQYTNKVNSTPFLGAATNTVKCLGIPGRLMYENSVSFWRVKFTFAYREDTWTRYVFDEGVYELDGGNMKPILDKAGQHIKSPVPLDGAGTQMFLNDPSITAKFVQFELKKRADFNALNLF